MLDAFTDTFGSRGWVRVHALDPAVIERALALASTDGLDEAEVFLVDTFSPAWVADRIDWLRYLDGFRERSDLALLALEDYRSGRYYASALVTLTLIDGWVNDVNVVDGQRRSLFSDEAGGPDTALPPALRRLQVALGRRRMTTRTAAITVPYRHGILHGMDLGYNNRVVAAKCWAALFAVRDWAVALTPWDPASHPSGPPDRVVSAYLEAWLEGNHNRMASCFAPMMRMIPGNARDQVEGLELRDFHLLSTDETAPNACRVKVKLTTAAEGPVTSRVVVFRLVLNTPEGDLAFVPTDRTVWGITSWESV